MAQKNPLTPSAASKAGTDPNAKSKDDWVVLEPEQPRRGTFKVSTILHKPEAYALISSTRLMCLDLAKIYTSTYVVQPGDTLMRIAMRYQVRSQELANVNNVFGDIIFTNQVSLSIHFTDLMTLY